WIGPAPIPDHVREYKGKWEAMMPEWTVRLWTNEDLTPEQFPQVLLDKICEAEAGAQKADLLRLSVLKKYGGHYFDADHQPLHTIEPLAKRFHWATAIACHYERWNTAYLANGYMAAVP